MEPLLPVFGGDPARPCTFGEDGEIALELLLRRAARLAAELPAPQEGSEVAFAFGTDRTAFAVALFATWIAGHEAALPVDAARENVAPVLDRDENAAFLQDTGVGRGIHVPSFLERTAEDAHETAPAKLDTKRWRLAFFAPRSDEPARKLAGARLLEEVDALVRRLELREGARVACTLSPTGPASVLAGLLAPLRAGARFEATVPRGVEACAAELPDTHCCVASAFHLRELRRAGAPLPEHTVEEDGLFGPEDSTEAERDLTRALLELDGVVDAIFLELETPAPDGSSAVAALVGAPGAEETAREALRPRLPAETVVAVRRLPALPRTVDGALIREELFLRLGWGRTGRGVSRELAWDEVAARPNDPEGVRRFRTKLPPAYAPFEGHFETYPLLAGAVQLKELVLPCVRRALPAAGHVSKLSNVKFLTRIGPEEELEVALRPTADGASFDIESGGARCSTGSLSLEPATPEPSAVRACAVVPTYDNPRTVRSVVEGIRAHGLEVVLVDDGSAEEGRRACREIEAAGLATLITFPRNRGKGVAARAGFRKALELGFTHGFQIDADGQHDLGRIPDFLGAAAEHPDALVLAYPVYDESAPRHRLIARRFTTFWVTLELGNRTAIVDALIGFRVYPLEAALAVRSGDRMDFDVEIAVRMVRAGAPTVNLPVPVHYPAAEEGGVSHFRPVRDNLRFSVMHGRLCTSGCLRWAWRAIARRPWTRR